MTCLIIPLLIPPHLCILLLLLPLPIWEQSLWYYSMLPILFGVLLAIHGLIHLLGTAKAFNWLELKKMELPVTKNFGVFWFVAALLFLLSLTFYIINMEWWWTAFIAVLLSQVLISMSWGNARFGTIANILILLVILPAIGRWKFKQDGLKQEEQIVRKADNIQPMLITAEMIASKPYPVQQWLNRAGVLTKSLPPFFRLLQSGSLVTAPGQDKISFSATQISSSSEPEFVWRSQMTTTGGITIDGRDKLLEGKGAMKIRLMGLYPIANAEGKEIDQGSLLRYLSEIGCMPMLALKTFISWEAVDSVTAKASIHNIEQEVSGLFHFTKDGDFLSFTAERYYTNGQSAPRLEEWEVRVVPDCYKVVKGIRVPYKFEISWNLKEGKWTWMELMIN
jgi:hypothetical protein